jgi:hypothetical protein
MLRIWDRELWFRRREVWWGVRMQRDRSHDARDRGKVGEVVDRSVWGVSQRSVDRN